jgi:hypothetical protein
MTAPPPATPAAEPAGAAGGPPACPCGGEMWFLPFGYNSWVCRRNTRHWFRPDAGRWSGESRAPSADSG